MILGHALGQFIFGGAAPNYLRRFRKVRDLPHIRWQSHFRYRVAKPPSARHANNQVSFQSCNSDVVPFLV